MTTYFITRHAGAVEWARTQGIKAEQLSHLDTSVITPGDTVIGTLPVHIVAEICTRGARYFHMVLDLPSDARGRGLSAAEMTRFGARLEQYHVMKKETRK